MNALVPKVYPLLVEAIEAGVRLGYNRAFKHTDTPSDDFVIEHIQRSVEIEILERFNISEETS